MFICKNTTHFLTLSCFSYRPSNGLQLLYYAYISIKKSSKCILYKFFRSLWGYVGGALPPAPSHKEFPVVMVFPLKKCTLEL